MHVEALLSHVYAWTSSEPHGTLPERYVFVTDRKEQGPVDRPGNGFGSDL